MAILLAEEENEAEDTESDVNGSEEVEAIETDFNGSEVVKAKKPPSSLPPPKNSLSTSSKVKVSPMSSVLTVLLSYECSS